MKGKKKQHSVTEWFIQMKNPPSSMIMRERRIWMCDPDGSHCNEDFHSGWQCV